MGRNAGPYAGDRSQRAGYPVSYTHLDVYKRQAQPYTVDLYSHSVATLQRGDAIYPLLDGSVWVLKERYYDDQLGVVSEAGKMDMWSV